MQKINLADACAAVTEPFTPVLLGALNGQHVRLARIAGTFVWHDHAHEDEMFMVVQGSMRVEMRDQIVHLEAGEMFIVPRGVEHRTVAEDSAHVMIFVQGSAVTTGDVQHTYTMRQEDLER